MRRIFTLCCFYILILKITSYSDLVQNNYTYHSTSLLLFSNPSLIVNQSGIPITTVFLLPQTGDKFEGTAAMSFILDKKAFALGYQHNESVKNKLISGYSLIKDFFYFGTSFSFLFDSNKEPDFLLDAASTVKLKKYSYISLVFNNIIATNNINKIIVPKGTLSFFGGFPGIEKYLGFDVSYYCDIFNFKKGKIDQGGKMDVIGSFSESPMIYYSTGYELLRDKYKKFNQIFRGSLGLQIRINELSAGLSYGIDYDVTNSDYQMNLTVNFNPTVSQLHRAQSIDLKIKEGTETNPGVYVSFSCSDPNGSGIKNWVLVFSTLPSNNGRIIKSFSGGNIPPSTVYWDLRDVLDNFHDQQIMYIRGIITDKKKNISVTPWISFDPQKCIN